MKPLLQIVDARKHRSPSMFQHPREGWAITVRYIGGVLASYRRAVPHKPMPKERAQAVLFRYISKARVAGMDLDLCLLPHLETIRDGDGNRKPVATALPVTWHQCDPECPGWCHMDDSGGRGPAIEACDSCERFTRWDSAAELDTMGKPVPGYVTRDGLAREAHAKECGCSWGSAPAPEALRVVRSTDWRIHGNATYGSGMWGTVTECEARGLTFYVRENIRGDRFMIGGGQRLGMKKGQIPKGFEQVLDVAAPAEHLAWILDLVQKQDASDAKASEAREAPARRAVTHAGFTMNTAPSYFEPRNQRGGGVDELAHQQRAASAATSHRAGEPQPRSLHRLSVGRGDRPMAASRDRLAESIKRRAFVRFWRRMLFESIASFYRLRRPTCQIPRGPLRLPCGRPAREFDHVHPKGRWWVVREISYDLRIILYWLEWMAFVEDGDTTKQLRLACRRCNAGYNPHRHFRRNS